MFNVFSTASASAKLEGASLCDDLRRCNYTERIPYILEYSGIGANELFVALEVVIVAIFICLLRESRK